MSLSFWIRDYVFLPLATLRREVWWRNLALVVAMVLFGLWHRASLLFLLWGCYHGVLLVLHRQVQQLQRKFDWTPPAIVWTPVSWITTMAALNLGWIFFRAKSLVETRQMLSAVVSPESYLGHFLSGSLYLLVAGLAVGYATVLLVIAVLDRHSVEPQPLKAAVDPGVMGLIARWRWLWIAPLYAVALIFLLIVTFAHGTSAAQFMYGNF